MSFEYMDINAKKMPRQVPFSGARPGCATRMERSVAC
jgi:hypothetical protein